jgi:hypothetical protein
MTKTIWKVYLDYGSGYGWVPVRWAPVFDTEEEAREWAHREDHDWDAPLDVMSEEWEQDEEDE